MQLPSSIQSQFSDTYNGVPAARFRSTTEAKNMEAALREHRQSYQTKINKSKKTGREFIVMLLEPVQEVPSGT